MAGQALVTHAHRDRKLSRHGLRPGARSRGHGPLRAARLERQAHDELGDALLANDRAEASSIARKIGAAWDRDVREGWFAAGFRYRKPDPALTEVDPEEPAHGVAPALPVGAGEPDVSDGGTTVNVTRDSLSGIVVTQSGQTEIVTSP